AFVSGRKPATRSADPCGPVSRALYTSAFTRPSVGHAMSTPGTLRQYALFIAGSVLGGIAVALLALEFWPGLGGKAGLAGRSGAWPGSAGATEAGMLLQPAATFAPAVQRSAPAVVSIYTRRAEPAPHVEHSPGQPVA